MKLLRHHWNDNLDVKEGKLGLALSFIFIQNIYKT